MDAHKTRINPFRRTGANPRTLSFTRVAGNSLNTHWSEPQRPIIELTTVSVRAVLNTPKFSIPNSRAT